jgi:hypothetical protein
LLASITPLGERSRRSRWGVTVSALILGATGGGAALGLAFGTLGSVTIARLDLTALATAVAFAAVVGVGIAVDRGVFAISIPTFKRQVAKEWMTEFRGWVYGLGFGIQLGVGFATIVTSAATYTAFAAAFLAQTPARGAAIGGVYGLIRGAVNLAAWRINSPEQLLRFHHALEQQGAAVARPTVIVEAGAIAIAVVGTVVIGGIG